MRYRVFEVSKKDYDIITEDGGIVSIHETEEYIVSTYCQSRIPEHWEGKQYVKEWEHGTAKDAIVKDALNWLVFPAPQEWEHDDTLLEDVLN